MNRFIIGSASLGVGILHLIPAAVEASTLLIDEEGHKELMKTYISSLSEEQKQLQQHVNDHCKQLKIQPIPVAPIEGQPGLGILFNFPLIGPVITVPAEYHDNDLIRGIVNHELGHYFHKHQLQYIAVNSVIGALFFFKKTRKLACASLAAFTITKNSWRRFHERQADAHSIRYSTREELKAMIDDFSTKLYYPKPSNPSLTEKVEHILFATHPYTEDRIAVMKKAVKEKSKQ